jgi:hypothetical protein
MKIQKMSPLRLKSTDMKSRGASSHMGDNEYAAGFNNLYDSHRFDPNTVKLP